MAAVRLAAVGALALLAACAGGPAGVRALEADLDARASATAVLDARCAAVLGRPDAAVRAERVAGAETPAPPEVRALLRAGPDEPVRHRRVRLVCGDEVYSEADNWYRPGRLTAEMNRRLDQTDTPFGRAVQALDFQRRALSSERLDPASGRVLRRRAVLLAGGEPFSLVVETYPAAALAGR